MSINLLQKIQENLNYPTLHKIDPSTQQVKGADNTITDHLGQAAIPAVLTGLIKYCSAEEGALEFSRGDYSTDWVQKIFGNEKLTITQSISSYAQKPENICATKMDEIVSEALKIAKESLPEVKSTKETMLFFSSQLNNVLPYLPSELHIGDLLNDANLDDNTNKMDGPISSLMHNIGKIFSTPETEEDKRNSF
jgi:hypothetical protein